MPEIFGLKRLIYTMLIRLIQSMLTPVLKNHIYTIKHGLGRGSKIKGGLGFLRVRHCPTAEERFLSNLDLRGKTVYDIGAHIGIFTMFFAQSVGKTGKVITFEPNPESYIQIQENVKLNSIDNVEIVNIGVGNKRETKRLVVSKYSSARGGGSMTNNISSQILKEKASKSFQVEVHCLDDYIEGNKLPKPDFVKIDVEGMEFDVLSGMSNIINRYKPLLYIEMHGVDVKNKIRNVQRVTEFLDLHKYSIYHIESEQLISTATSQIAKEGHLFCAKNLAELENINQYNER